jgi:hypothetical protein
MTQVMQPLVITTRNSALHDGLEMTFLETKQANDKDKQDQDCVLFKNYLVPLTFYS